MIEHLHNVVEPIDDRFEPADALDVQTLQSAVGTRLPDAWVALLTTFGALGFAGDATVTARDGTGLEVFTLYGCKPRGGEILRDFKSHEDYPTLGLIPIGDDMFNNRFVWERETGRVLFIDYSHAHGTMRIVADSFDEFVSGISVVPDKTEDR